MLQILQIYIRTHRHLHTQTRSDTQTIVGKAGRVGAVWPGAKNLATVAQRRISLALSESECALNEPPFT